MVTLVGTTNYPKFLFPKGFRSRSVAMPLKTDTDVARALRFLVSVPTAITQIAFATDKKVSLSKPRTNARNVNRIILI